jgi:hypothetical protein
MATQAEKEELAKIRTALALHSTDIMKQADAVTDRATRIRISRLAQGAWALADRLTAVVGDGE